MEQESFFSGYCRVMDQSRTVCTVKEDGVLSEVDCGFGGCPYEDVCTVAQKIRDFLKSE